MKRKLANVNWLLPVAAFVHEGEMLVSLVGIGSSTRVGHAREQPLHAVMNLYINYCTLIAMPSKTTDYFHTEELLTLSYLLHEITSYIKTIIKEYEHK